MISLTNKYLAFCLLDLSAAFDTLDHSIVPHHLSSWFGVSSFFLSSGSPHTCRFSHLPLLFHLIFLPHPRSLVAFHKALSGPILLNVYSFTISRMLYANDTQLFISFIPKNLSLAISDLQSNISLISIWMSSNYLTLNLSKTEFLLIGLPQQNI